MHQDPLTRWEDGFPYDLLAGAGITPESPARAVRDAAFVLLRQGGMSREARLAWDRLRQPGARLVVDFFLLAGDPAEGAR